MMKWLLLVSSLLIAGSVEAGIRVLFSFDASGHFVHRTIHVESHQQLSSTTRSLVDDGNLAEGASRTLSISPIERGRSWENATIPKIRGKQAELIDGFVRLVWLDMSGSILTQTEVADPRIVHSPAHAEGVNASRSGLIEGAWLAVGPVSAVRVTLHFPESTSLGLAAESWTLDLKH